jgi:hypothetical protein
MPLRKRFKGFKQVSENVENRQDEPKRGIGEKVKFLTSLFGKKRRKDKRASGGQVVEEKVIVPVVDKGKAPIRPENIDVTAPILDKGKAPIRPENPSSTYLTLPVVKHRRNPSSEAPIPVEFDDDYYNNSMMHVPFGAAGDLTNEDTNMPTELSTRESSAEDVAQILTVKVGTPSESDCKPQRGVSNASSQVAEIVQVTPDGSLTEYPQLSTLEEETQRLSAGTSVDDMGNTQDMTKSDLLEYPQTEDYYHSSDDIIEPPTGPTKSQEVEDVVQEPSILDGVAEKSDEDADDDYRSCRSGYLPRSTSMPGTWFTDEEWIRW